jgi:hypothetical protein
VTFLSKIPQTLTVLFLLFSGGIGTRAQEAGARAANKATQKPEDKSAAPEKPSPTTAEKVALPFQIQLLETHIRFEKDGDSRKEVHTIVKINNVLGIQEFGRLKFDYNRGWQQVEIPMVRVTHANGGTSEALPSAVTDAANPAVEKYPAYQDVRVKSVRILGLEEGDTIEYRVITTTAKHPLAPDFWVEHTFDRSGQVLEEDYELDLPESRMVQLRTNPDTPAQSNAHSGDGETKRTTYQWKRLAARPPEADSSVTVVPDVSVTTFASWSDLAKRLDPENEPGANSLEPLKAKANQLSGTSTSKPARLAAYYDFVRKEITTVDLPLMTIGFRYRTAGDVLSSGYGTVADKFVLLRALAANSVGELRPVFIGDQNGLMNGLAIPSDLTKLLATIVIFPPGKPGGNGHTLVCTECEKEYWLDIGLDVAPFGMVRASLRGKLGLREPMHSDQGRAANSEHLWHRIPDLLPFAAKQSVGIVASIDSKGDLRSTVKYKLRGDNELLLREAFHQTAKEKWKDVAGLLALSDGFRGVITSATASDPMATNEPFTVEYELKQEKFVDWAKKPVRIPPLLPQIGLPDGTERSAGHIVLGTPLDVETQATMHLPEGTKVQAPAGTAVDRDYAAYSSKYGASADTLTAQRRIRFLRREVAVERAMDYSAFVQAVQNDQAQYFVLDRGVGVKSAGVQ